MKTIRDRLSNWARWSRGAHRMDGRSNTAFICDRMRAARQGELPSAPGTGERLDVDDADLVERAWKRLAPKHRELLRWHYIRHANPAMICRRMGIKPRPTSIFDLELARAETEIAKALAAIAEQAQGFRGGTRTNLQEAA